MTIEDKIRDEKLQYDIKQYETVRSFGEIIHTRKTNIVEAEEDQSNLLKNMVEFNKKSNQEQNKVKIKKEICS